MSSLLTIEDIYKLFERSQAEADRRAAEFEKFKIQSSQEFDRRLAESKADFDRRV